MTGDIAFTYQLGGHAGLLREFVVNARSGGTPKTVCADNTKSLAMVSGAIDNATRGAPVQTAI